MLDAEERRSRLGMSSLLSQDGRAEAEGAVEVHLMLCEDVLVALQQRGGCVCQIPILG